MVPPMSQSVEQVPEAQIMPASHAAPSPSVVQLEVDCEGSQSWHASLGLVAAAETMDPPMSQEGEQTPEAQSMPLPQAVPSGSEVQLVLDLEVLQSWQSLAGLIEFASTIAAPM
jgi:hypothetical protein